MPSSLLLVCLAVLAQTNRPTVAVAPVQLDETARAGVPELIDDYVLSAVQDLGRFEVIGQDDINTLVGLEKQKELLGCDDVSCFADIGGALGVEKIIVVKVARVGEQWATTAKVIATKPPKVEARLSRFVDGDAAALLKAVAPLVAELFGAGPPPSLVSAAAPPAPAPASREPTGWELDLTVAPFPIGWDRLPELDPGEETIGYKYFLLTPRLQWRHTDLGAINLLAEASLGAALARLYSADPGDGMIYDNDTAGGWLSLMEVLRLALVRGDERWGALSTDRLAVDVAAGAYVQVGSAIEAGLAARFELRVFWLSAGVMVTLGPDTGVDIGFPISLRFGF